MSWSSRGLLDLLGQGSAIQDFRFVAMKDPYVQSPQHVFLSDVVQWEPSGPGYQRKVMHNTSRFEDPQQHYASIFSDPLAAYPGANFGTIVGGWVVSNTGTDSTTVLWKFLALSPVIATTGGDVQLAWPPEGWGNIAISKAFAP